MPKSAAHKSIMDLMGLLRSMDEEAVCSGPYSFARSVLENDQAKCVAWMVVTKRNEVKFTNFYKNDHTCPINDDGTINMKHPRGPLVAWKDGTELISTTPLFSAT